MAEKSLVFKDNEGLGSFDKWLKNNSNTYSSPRYGAVSKQFTLPKYETGFGLARTLFGNSDNIAALNSAYNQYDKLSPAQQTALNEHSVAMADAGAFSDGLFSMEGLEKIGEFGGLAMSALNIGKGLDDLFGSGKQARKLALEAGHAELDDFKNRSAQRIKDTARFEQTRDDQTAAYFNTPKKVGGV